MLKYIILLLSLSLPAFAQFECSTLPVPTSPLVSHNTTDQFGIVHQNVCIDSVTGRWYFTNNTSSAGGSPFSGLTSGTNNQAIMIVNSGASLSPINLGQVAGNQVWFPQGLATPIQGNFSAVNSGGSIGSGHVIFVQFTLNSALGEGLPSAIFSPNLTTAGCTIGSCTLTMAAPTIPSGYSGWTMYFCDQSGGGGCSTTPQKVLACSNIATSCAITNAALNSGVSVPTINASIPQPPNIQATLCPQGTIPSLFMTDTNTGNTFTQGGVIGTKNGNFNDATFTFCRRTWFNDESTAQVFANAFVSVNHLAGTGTSLLNQDRAIAYSMNNGLSDTSSHYAMEGIQGEVDLQGSPASINGSPDGEVASLSAQVNDSTKTGGASPSNGIVGLRTSVFRTDPADGSNAGTGWNRYYGVNSQMSNGALTTAATAGTQMVGVLTSWSNGGGAIATNLQGMGFKIQFPNTANKFGALNIGMEIPNVAMTITPGSDWLIDNLFAGLPSNLNGAVGAASLVAENASGSFAVNAPINVQPSITVTQGTIPSPASVVCSGGASSYSYEFVGVDANGGTVTSTAGNSAGTCTNPLTSGNPATVNTTNSIATLLQYAEFVRIDVYRTAGPMALGKVGSLTCNSISRTMGIACNAFSDTGIAATTAVPTVNTTGGISAYNYITSTNCAGVGSAANPSLVACGSASAGSFSCATNASAGTCVISTTAVTANSEIFIQQRSDATTGTRLGVTCNTGVTTVIPDITAVTAGTSFTINLGTIAVNPECMSYHIVN